MKILLLEDELMLQSAIVEYLTDTGYKVDAFEDGQEAFNSSLENSYDLFIFDINTPTVDGLTLLENLQKEKIFVPTIFISAITEIEQISKAYELGCYDYLKKPFHLKELTLHMERLLQMAQVESKSIVKISTSMISKNADCSLTIRNKHSLPNRHRSLICSLVTSIK